MDKKDLERRLESAEKQNLWLIQGFFLKRF